MFKRTSKKELQTGKLPSGGTGSGSTIHTGAGTPSDILGVDGDLYIDTDPPNNFYKKIAGVYVLQGELQGEAGVDGTDGTNGAPGTPGPPGEDGLPGPGIYLFNYYNFT